MMGTTGKQRDSEDSKGDSTCWSDATEEPY